MNEIQHQGLHISDKFFIMGIEKSSHIITTAQCLSEGKQRTHAGEIAKSHALSH